MKCIICQAEIDESKAFPPIEGPGGRPIEDLTGRLQLARMLEKWISVTITAQVPGGCKTIRSGHLCPAHNPDDVTFGLLLPIVTKPEPQPKNESPRKESKS